MKSLEMSAEPWFLEAMKLTFAPSPIPDNISAVDWQDWMWQLRHSLKTRDDFAQIFQLSEDEAAGFEVDSNGAPAFQIRSTPYYASLASRGEPRDPIRRILMPTRKEFATGAQAMLDPLNEKKNSPAPRIIHRYPDRVLFLVTDTCSVYCRYCTRKHFTGGDQAFVRSRDYAQALDYIKSKPGVREVILSGGDPLTLSDAQLERVLGDLRSIESVEIVRIGSRMPVVCPMRVTPALAAMIRRYHPVFMMTHFNHPRELTAEAALALAMLVDHGVPVFNQLVLLNGVNNDPAIVQALSRRLLYLRAKPYYMFQCDPSEGTDHLRISVDESLDIQRELWGRLSGLAMPNLSLDIPNGGGKAALTPNFEVSRSEGRREYVGWDGVRAPYIDPSPENRVSPMDAELYAREWDDLKRARDERT